jgi:hypothetical protein
MSAVQTIVHRAPSVKRQPRAKTLSSQPHLRIGLNSVRKSVGKNMRAWIGVDLDGTLAKSVKAQTEKRSAPQFIPWCNS